MVFAAVVRVVPSADRHLGDGYVVGLEGVDELVFVGEDAWFVLVSTVLSLIVELCVAAFAFLGVVDEAIGYDEGPPTLFSVHLDYELADGLANTCKAHFSKKAIARSDPLITEQHPSTFAVVSAQTCPSPWTQ